MKLDVSQVLKGYDGKPIKKAGVSEQGLQVVTKEVLTLKDVISNALNAADDNKASSAEDKLKSFNISLATWSNKELDLPVEDVAFIKAKVLKIYNPLICGRVAEILDKKAN